MKSTKAVMVLALSLCATVCADAQEAVPILAMPFENGTGEPDLDPLRKGLPDLVAAFLAPYEDAVQVVDREAIEHVFRENSLSWQHFLKDDKAGELGRLLQAKFILRGSVTGSSERIVVNAFLYETETTRLVKSFEAEGPPKRLTLLGQQLSSQIASFFKTKVVEFSELPPDEKPETSRAMIYGLGFYYNGQFHKALTYFLKVLERDPNHEEARYWLGKGFLGAGLREQARIEFEDFLKRFPASSRVKEIKGYLNRVRKEE